MAQYFVSFNGHLVERTRPDGWPKVVYDKSIYEAEAPDNLAGALNAKAEKIQQRGGMHVNFDKEELAVIRDESENKSDARFGAGFFIPMHMIAYINYTVRLIVGELAPMGSEAESKGMKQ